MSVHAAVAQSVRESRTKRFFLMKKLLLPFYPFNGTRPSKEEGRLHLDPVGSRLSQVGLWRTRCHEGVHGRQVEDQRKHHARTKATGSHRRYQAKGKVVKYNDDNNLHS